MSCILPSLTLPTTPTPLPYSSPPPSPFPPPPPFPPSLLPPPFPSSPLLPPPLPSLSPLFLPPPPLLSSLSPFPPAPPPPPLLFPIPPTSSRPSPSSPPSAASPRWMGRRQAPHARWNVPGTVATSASRLVGCAGDVACDSRARSPAETPHDTAPPTAGGIQRDPPCPQARQPSPTTSRSLTHTPNGERQLGGETDAPKGKPGTRPLSGPARKASVREDQKPARSGRPANKKGTGRIPPTASFPGRPTDPPHPRPGLNGPREGSSM